MPRCAPLRADPDMVELLVRNSLETLVWMRGRGVRFVPIYSRQAFKIGGKFKFWGGLTVEADGGGPGLVESLKSAIRRAGIEIFYRTRATDLIYEDFTVKGVRARRGDASLEFRARGGTGLRRLPG